MILTTLEQEIATYEKDLSSLSTELRALRSDLQSFREGMREAEQRAKSGEAPSGVTTTLQPADIKRINGLVDACYNTENRLEKCKAERAGIAQCGHAFDLAEARDAIGCKLDHLRACYGPEDVPDGAE